MNEIILSTQNGEPVASSRQIAENFEKRHDHVINKTPKVTGKGQIYFVNQFLNGRAKRLEA